MISLGKATRALLSQPVRFLVSDKFMKERDEAAEKVYISQQ